ncbi:putative nitrogen fixation protein NifT [Desulfurispirillum indicum]|uniref:Nitrogen fixation protein FixT n=1 Tax=Desulfurispirillum indicum (strain ATCC BAA-1389 / DSM 22839 / S5) TaxID=653733 RepID=E6W1I2_DESIS|nr:putative nitrogen fixation protein NifT [Desulfurispirillum indicum]ADU65438.1 nitrogen fixation protein FixT [Desulfurispirillum indicum S5]UCZ57357.1 putative nitrogen fixation protein NifT [Desulfurispirillum indicum]
MKIILSKSNDTYSVYVPKKDLEESVVDIAPEGGFGGTFTLANGWQLYIEPMDEEPRLPKTLDAKKL